MDEGGAQRSAGTVGVIGLGNIGRGVAASLAAQYPGRVLAWDAADSARQIFAARDDLALEPPAEIARRADVVLFVVPTTREVRQCLEQEGMLRAARPDLVVYDLTTSDPEDTRQVAAEAAAHGIAYLDAGTSGGPYKADVGKLLAMVGGDRDAFERTRWALDAICEHVFFVGPSGAGHTLKLLHNIVCHATTLATAEAGHMAERAGIALGDMIEVFNHSNARSYATEFRFPRHIVSQTWDGRSRIFNLHKDIQMGVQLGERLGADTTFTRATLKILSAAKAHGMENEDYTVLYRDFDVFMTPGGRTTATDKGEMEPKHQDS